MVSHMAILSGFHHRSYQVRFVKQLSFIFYVDHIYMTNHVVVLFGFRHSRHLIWSVMIVQYCFCHRLHLHNRSRHCLVWFSSQMALNLIGYDQGWKYQQSRIYQYFDFMNISEIYWRIFWKKILVDLKLLKTHGNARKTW